MRTATSKAMRVGTRKALLLFASALVALALSSGVALAEIKVGTDGPETLTGTNDNDTIIGRGGDDLTIGKRGDDAYVYADGWGIDDVDDSGGVDALDFSPAAQTVRTYLCPEVTVWGTNLGYSEDDLGNRVHYSSRIEKTTGGSADDIVVGCTGKNVLSGGGNDGTGVDLISDLGGYKQEGVNLPASSDVYTGFEAGSGSHVIDTGGKDDRLNLGAFGSRRVDLYRYDANGDGRANSLLIGFDGAFDPKKFHGILLLNHFGQDWGSYFRGTIETIKLKDKTLSAKAVSGNSLSVAPEAAGRALLPEAQTAGSEAPLLGLVRGSVG
jgi:hypothetical protein